MSRFIKRDIEIYERNMRGESSRVLADEYGLSQSRVCQIVTEVGRNMPEVDVSHLRALSADRLEFMQNKVLELISMPGAPTFTQRGDQLIDADGNAVLDYSLRLRALAELRAINATFGKRFGLDAPTQAEVKATVQYEIVGVDPEAMT